MANGNAILLLVCSLVLIVLFRYRVSVVSSILYLIAILKYALPFTTFMLKFLNLRNSCLGMVILRFFLIAASVFFLIVCFVPLQKILILLRKISSILSFLSQDHLLYKSEHRSLNYVRLLSRKLLCVLFFNLEDGCLVSFLSRTGPPC